MMQISTRRWVVILGVVVAIGPMSIDMYLPSLPALQRHFGVDTAATQLSLSAFFVGLALGQLVYGPVSDRIGRRKPLLFGLALYVLASLGCALAPSMQALTGLRFLQAIGGSAGIVITRAMVRDRFAPQEMARILSTLVLVMGAAPILAPTLGGQVFQWFGWQAIFVLLAAFGGLCLVLTTLNIDETQAVRGARLSLGSVLANYGRLFAHRRFMGYALSGSVAQGGMFAYISVSSFVFIDMYRLSPVAFGWLFGANAFGLIAASQLNGYFLKHHHSQHVLKNALATYAASGVLLLAAALTGIGGIWGVMLPLFVCVSSLGFTFPNSTAAAMAPFGDRAGTASALLGTLQFSIAAGSGALAGYLHNGTAVPMAAIIAVCGLLSVSLLHLLVGPPPNPDTAG